MQVLRLENPAFVSGLRPMQRVSYVATLLGWFEAWRTLGYLLAPMVVVLTGAVPVRASLAAFLAFFVPAFLLQRWALHLLSRGMAPQGISTVFDLVRMPANLRATLRLVSTRSRGFSVTSKGAPAPTAPESACLGCTPSWCSRASPAPHGSSPRRSASRP
jgi:cellulose synthase (UDP-forming)